MTGRSNEQHIPIRQKLGLRGDLNTSATTDGKPRRAAGTTNLGIEGLEYEDLPPPSNRHTRVEPYWTIEKISIYAGLAVILISVIIFFYRMDSNIEIIKTDIKEEKGKIEKLEESTNKQTSSLDNVTNSVERLEGEVSRTQDYIQSRRK